MLRNQLNIICDYLESIVLRLKEDLKLSLESENIKNDNLNQKIIDSYNFAVEKLKSSRGSFMKNFGRIASFTIPDNSANNTYIDPSRSKFYANLAEISQTSINSKNLPTKLLDIKIESCDVLVAKNGENSKVKIELLTDPNPQSFKLKMSIKNATYQTDIVDESVLNSISSGSGNQLKYLLSENNDYSYNILDQKLILKIDSKSGSGSVEISFHLLNSNMIDNNVYEEKPNLLRKSFVVASCEYRDPLILIVDSDNYLKKYDLKDQKFNTSSLYLNLNLSNSFFQCKMIALNSFCAVISFGTQLLIIDPYAMTLTKTITAESNITSLEKLSGSSTKWFVFSSAGKFFKVDENGRILKEGNSKEMILKVLVMNSTQIIVCSAKNISVYVEKDKGFDRNVKKDLIDSLVSISQINKNDILAITKFGELYIFNLNSQEISALPYTKEKLKYQISNLICLKDNIFCATLKFHRLMILDFSNLSKPKCRIELLEDRNVLGTKTLGDSVLIFTSNSIVKLKFNQN